MKLSTRLTIAMVALVSVTATAIGLLTYRKVAELALPRALDRVRTHALAVATELQASVRGARADVIGFRASNAVFDIMVARLNRGIDPGASATEAEWRRRLALRFVAELSSKSNYHEFSVIGVDDGGRELVRVDRSGAGGSVRVVPDAELQRQGDRYYFNETIQLPDGDVYVSPIDLHKENGAIETPHVPVLRVATPVHTPAGRPFGIIIIDVDLRPEFARFHSTKLPDTHVHIVNDSGDYLMHPDPGSEFGFEFGRPLRVQDDFPELAGIFGADIIAPRVVTDRAGAQFGVGLVSVRLAGGTPVTVVEAMPYAQLMSTATSVRDTTLLGGLAAVVGAVALAVAISRSLTRPMVQMTRAVEGFAGKVPIAAPTGGGREIGVLASAFARMVTEVREKTAALNREIEERRRIFESSPDLMLVTDREGNLVRASPSSEAILGYRPEELTGRGGAEFVYPDDLANTQEEMRSARRGEHMRNFETRCVHKEGRVVTLAWMGVWSEPGQQYFFIGRDMTESKKAQEALLESEQMGRGIVATALDAFVQLDETGHVLEWNLQAEAIFGWSRQEAVGQPLTSLYLPAGYRPRYLDLSARMKQSDENEMVGERFEFEAVRKDGKKVKLEISMTSLRRRSGFVFNLFLRDLTEKIATEEQLRHAQKMDSVGQITGGIAHDFNNMLTVITGTIEILAEAVADKPQLAAIAKLISQAADRGAELTGHLLAFARKQPLQPRETDINALMVESAKLMRATLGEHIEIKPMLANDVWPALVDANQLSSALLNLAINARDAMPNGGKLTLETGNIVLDKSYARTNSDAQLGNYVMIAVSDTGIGIPEAIREKVYEPFFSTKGVGKGTGLGLSMVYGFVKQSGGHIKIYSEEGHGTTIKIYLPQTSAQPEQMAETSPVSWIEGGTETILVVEDDALVRTYVNAQLRDLGYKTLSAASAAEALAIADSGEAFELLFTDVIMPGKMNGPQLVEEMAKRRSPLKVLFTSGYTENALIHQGRLDPGVLLLAKPYRKLELAQMVRLALASAGMAPSRRPDIRSAHAS